MSFMQRIQSFYICVLYTVQYISPVEVINRQFIWLTARL